MLLTDFRDIIADLVDFVEESPDNFRQTFHIVTCFVDDFLSYIIIDIINNFFSILYGVIDKQLCWLRQVRYEGVWVIAG